MNLLTLLLFLFCPAPVSADEVDSFLNAYYLAEGKLSDFDKELFQSRDADFLARSRPYRDLLALRVMLEEKAEKFASNLSSREALLSRMENPSPLERIALQDLIPHLRARKIELTPFFSSLDEELLFRRRNKNSMASFARRAGKNRNLLEEVKRISESLIFENGSERKPPAIVPGAGPEGNINGSQFPPRTWALTFDDGPHETFTPQILANLGKLGKHVSFFWLIECLEKNPLLPRKAMELGHALENHSWSHENLDKADPQTLYKEIVKSSERDPDFYGEKPLFFRLPYGAGLSNKTVRQMIAEQKMVHVFWNVDSLDWKDKDPNSILERVKKEMALAKRGIVLFHDIHPQSVEASNLLLRWSDSLAGSPEAHRWVKIPEIVDELNRQKKSPLTTSPGAAHPDQK